MGVFGSGLYSGDFALDLRSAIRAASHLPFDGDKLVSILRQLEVRAADDPADEDHTTFWLVLADQFAKRGIDSPQLRDKALDIIASGAALARLQALGMKAAGLKQRARLLDELRDRLLQPVVAKPRPVLRNPQPYLMQPGDVLIYPTWGGRLINPYMPREKQFAAQAQDGWGAIVMIDCGRAFDFLAWYRPVTVLLQLAERPTLDSLRAELPWRLSDAGTCSPAHFKRMELQKLGSYILDAAKVQHEVPSLRPGTSAAINDISMANHIATPPAHKSSFTNWGSRRPLVIQGLSHILKS